MKLKSFSKQLFLTGLVIALLFPSVARADDRVEVYSGPGNGAYMSDLYKVEIRDNLRWLDSYTYKVARRSRMTFKAANHLDPSVNFTTFGTLAGTDVRVSKLNSKISSCEISPFSKKIAHQIADGQVIFHLQQHDKAWLVIDNDEGNPLFIFADPPKPPIPSNAIYFGPGIHDIGLAHKIKSGETVYVDGGAWLQGTFDFHKQSNITVEGPGVLSGEKTPAELVSKIDDKSIYHMLSGGGIGSNNNRILGLTVVNSPSYNTDGGLDYIGDVKLISPWFYSTDGFHLQGHPGGTALLENCFAFIGDDVFFPRENYNGNLEFRNSFVSSTNNSIFQICYWGYTLNHSYAAYLHDIDIKTYFPSKGAAVFKASINGGQDTGVRNMTFENIHIEGDLKCPLIQIENRPYFWPEQTTKPETKLGNTYNMVFKNITAGGASLPKSTLLGLDDHNGQHDYLFENVVLNRTPLNNENRDMFIEINDFCSSIRFISHALPQ